MSLFAKTDADSKKSAVIDDSAIRTMQDDLDAIDGIISQTSFVQEDAGETKTQSASQTNSGQQSGSMSNTNPFISQEKTQSAEDSTKPLYTKEDPVSEYANPTPNITIKGSAQPETPKLIISLVIAIILISIGGIYYFLTTRSVSLDTQPETATTGDSQKSSALFSVDMPNFLPIDTMHSTPESIQAVLLQTAQQTTSLNSARPIEFIITDTDNNPISFASFSKLANITLSQATIVSLGEKFSLFIYTSNGTPHIGLTIDIKDKTVIQEAMRQEEASLARSLSPLFLNDRPTETPMVFSDGTYANIQLRYVNLNKDTHLSVDYAITDRRLVIGTSMETHHALLDSAK